MAVCTHPCPPIPAHTQLTAWLCPSIDPSGLARTYALAERGARFERRRTAITPSRREQGAIVSLDSGVIESGMGGTRDARAPDP